MNEIEITTPNGTKLMAKALAKPVGQFSHWYLNSDGEPRYLIVREANKESFAFDEAVNVALSKALASDRYLVAVFTVVAAANGADRVVELSRVSHNFPFDAFEESKRQFCQNLDDEFKAPKPLKLADFVGRGVGDLEQGEAGKALKYVERQPPRTKNDALVAALKSMNTTTEGRDNGEKSSD